MMIASKQNMKNKQFRSKGELIIRRATPTLLAALVTFTASATTSLGVEDFNFSDLFNESGNPIFSNSGPFDIGLTGYFNQSGISPYMVDDPGDQGEYETIQYEYENEGNERFQELVTTSGIDFEFKGNVTYPATSDGGKWPLIVILHGRHESVYRERPEGTDVDSALEPGDPGWEFDSTNSTPKDPKWQTGYIWPPTDDFIALPNYKGHNKLAHHIASHGFVVANISVNAIVASDSQSDEARTLGQFYRSDMMQAHMEFLESANSGLALDGRLTNMVDFDAGVGLMGHSRGGHAALVNGFLNTNNTRFKIGAVFALAPSNNGPIPIQDVPVGIMVGYADGDTGMAGINLYEGIQNTVNYAADSESPDVSPNHLFVVMGANHTYFNEYWTPGGPFEAATVDDLFTHPDNSGIGLQNCFTKPLPGTPGPRHYSQEELTSTELAELKSSTSGRLTADKQRQVANAYATGFFETYLKKSTTSLPILTGADILSFPSLRLEPQDILVNYAPPNIPSENFNINPFDTDSHSKISPAFGTPVVLSNFAETSLRGGPSSLFDENDLDKNLAFMLNINQLNPIAHLEPHSRGFLNEGAGAIRVSTKANQLELGTIRNSFSADINDISSYDAIQFRLGVHFENTVLTKQDSMDICEARVTRKQSRFWDVNAETQVFVTLTDVNGNSQRIAVDSYSAATLIPPGLPGKARNIMNQVRIPITHFTEVDVTSLAHIDLEVGPGTDVQFSDLALTSLPDKL